MIKTFYIPGDPILKLFQLRGNQFVVTRGVVGHSDVQRKFRKSQHLAAKCPQWTGEGMRTHCVAYIIC